MSVSLVFIMILSSFMQLLVVDMFFSIYGERRIKSKSLKILFLIIATSVNTIFTIFIKTQILFTILTILVVILYSITFKMKWMKQIFCVIAICIAIILFEMLFALLYGLLYDFTIPETQNDPLVYLQIAVCSKLFLLVCVKILQASIIRRKSSSSLLAVLGVSILPVTTFLILYILSRVCFETNNVMLKTAAIIVSMLLIISNLVVFVIYDNIMRQKDKEKELLVNQTISELEKEYYRNLSEKQTDSSKTLHDLKNMAYALKTLISQDNEKAKSKFNELCGVLDNADAVKIVSIPSVDGMFASKNNSAKNKGIQINIVSFLSRIISIDDIDLCIILGNLLDNSIEACEQLVDGKVINIDIKSYKEYLSISISNPLPNDFSKRNIKNLKTSKSDIHEHGFGIANVKEIVLKYSGIYDVAIEDNTYTTNIMI